MPRILAILSKSIFLDLTIIKIWSLKIIYLSLQTIINIVIPTLIFVELVIQRIQDVTNSYCREIETVVLFV